MLIQEKKQDESPSSIHLYAGLDVYGKVVIVMVNDPGFWSGDTTLFKGKDHDVLRTVDL
ncbi:MAG: hypothetical protein ABIR66_08225 [Saprospiraceae bacterium]